MASFCTKPSQIPGVLSSHMARTPTPSAPDDGASWPERSPGALFLQLQVWWVEVSSTPGVSTPSGIWVGPIQNPQRMHKKTT